MDLMTQEEFSSYINEIPKWVKNEEDLKKYLKHIKFRYLQLKHCHSEYSKNFGGLEDKFFVEAIDRHRECYDFFEKMYAIEQG